MVVALVGVALPASSQDFDRHPHMLLQRPVVDLLEVEEGVFVLALVGYRKCVDLAGGEAVPLHAHHVHLHFGHTGEKLFEKAGHVVVPVAPFPAPFADPVPWTGCSDFGNFLPLPIPED